MVVRKRRWWDKWAVWLGLASPRLLRWRSIQSSRCSKNIPRIMQGVFIPILHETLWEIDPMYTSMKRNLDRGRKTDDDNGEVAPL